MQFSLSIATLDVIGYREGVSEFGNVDKLNRENASEPRGQQKGRR